MKAVSPFDRPITKQPKGSKRAATEPRCIVTLCLADPGYQSLQMYLNTFNKKSTLQPTVI